MKPVQMLDNIWWVGVQNPELKVFDVVMRTEWGTSYNSYLVKGSEKTALIDSVRDGYLPEQLDGLREICDPSKIDYIVCNHTEPDHSGSLKAMLEQAPDAVVVCSRAAKALIAGLINRDFACMVVGDGDTLDLGDKTLSFISAPFLHWPDTMFTYLKSDGVLFSCDAFGFHFSAKDIFDDKTPLTDAMEEARKYYFDVIMSPFKPYVLEAVGKIRDMEIKMIAPSHGPVLRGDPWGAVNRYEKWAQPEKKAKKSIYIGYVSCYGYTKKLAEKVREGMESAGADLDICMEDIGECGVSSALEKIHGADAFALGSPTLNRDVLPPIWDVMTGLSAYVDKGKKAAVFGTFGWSGEACKYMEQRLANLGINVLGQARAKLDPDEEELKAAFELGAKLAKAVV